jgi:hypothetical protein
VLFAACCCGGIAYSAAGRLAVATSNRGTKKQLVDVSSIQRAVYQQIGTLSTKATEISWNQSDRVQSARHMYMYSIHKLRSTGMLESIQLEHNGQVC